VKEEGEEQEREKEGRGWLGNERRRDLPDQCQTACYATEIVMIMRTGRASYELLSFLQILPTIAFLFFFRTDSTDSPDCLPTLVSITVSVYFLVFLFFFNCLVVGSMR